MSIKLISLQTKQKEHINETRLLTKTLFTKYVNEPDLQTDTLQRIHILFIQTYPKNSICIK